LPLPIQAFIGHTQIYLLVNQYKQLYPRYFNLHSFLNMLNNIGVPIYVDYLELKAHKD